MTNFRPAICLALVVATGACGTSPEEFAETVRDAASCNPDDTCVAVLVYSCGYFYTVINSSKVEDVESAARDVDCEPHTTPAYVEPVNLRCENGFCVGDNPDFP